MVSVASGQAQGICLLPVLRRWRLTREIVPVSLERMLPRLARQAETTDATLRKAMELFLIELDIGGPGC
jgi:hypothetical protein